MDTQTKEPLKNKIDFAVVLRVRRANPNGDPLNGNRPRTDYNGFGEITDVCIKRKIRDRLQENGHSIFVQSDDRKKDSMKSLKDRAESKEHGLGKEAFASTANKETTIKEVCEKWIDARTFGQLFAWGKKNPGKKGEGNGNESSDEAGDNAGKSNKKTSNAKGAGVSIAIRGPVSIHSAFSVQPVEITSTQITKSVNGETKSNAKGSEADAELEETSENGAESGEGTKRGSDTMGMKHRIEEGVYVFYGSMNPQLAERTGFSDDDALAIKAVLPKLFENDASSARPEGSMEILKLVWWQHNCTSGQHSSAKVHRSLKIEPNGDIKIDPLEGLDPEITEGW